MRVLHVTPYYLPARRYGGPIQTIHGLCTNLAKRGHEVHVFTTNVNGRSDSNVPIGTPVDLDGVRIWYFRSEFLRSFYFSPAMQRALFNRIKNYDLIHIHSIYTWPTGAATQMARRFRIPYIVSPRGMLVKGLIQREKRLLKTVWIQLIGRRCLENAAGIHMTTELEASEAEKFGFKLPQLFVVPNGVGDEILNHLNIKKISPAIENILKKTPFLLFLGRVDWKKGLDRLIPALAYVPGVHLVIAGNDDENYLPILEKLAGRYKVRDRIVMTGPVYGGEKIALLKGASLFVLPSYSENFGVAVLEAMAVGCPVVVTPQVGLADVVRKAGAGRVVDGDPKILGESLRDMLRKPLLLKEMGKSGEKVVLDQFRWDRVAQQMEEVYQKITAGRAGDFQKVKNLNNDR